MELSILHSPEIRQIIEIHRNKPVSEVVFALQKLPPELRLLIAEQIQGYQKAKTKIPAFCENPQIIFPPKINLEQSSSQLTALWKAQNIVKQSLTLTDLTGGFGVDSWAFSQVCNKVYYVEANPTLAAIAKHNFQLLGAHHIDVSADTASNYLTYAPATDWIYLDPARRDNKGKSIAQITDTQPNVLELFPAIFRKANLILLKASPMLDLWQALQILPAVQKVWVVALENECKEVLFHLSEDAYRLEDTTTKQNVSIEAVNVQSDGGHSSFMGSIWQEQEARCMFSSPQTYIYEPNAAILKAGFFKWVGQYFNLYKLHKHTHLYSHTVLNGKFQGRVFKVIDLIEKIDWKKLSKQIAKANIIARNYPLSVEQIRKQSQIKEGGELFLIFTTWADEQKGVIVAQRCK